MPHDGTILRRAHDAEATLTVGVIDGSTFDPIIAARRRKLRDEPVECSSIGHDVTAFDCIEPATLKRREGRQPIRRAPREEQRDYNAVVHV